MDKSSQSSSKLQIFLCHSSKDKEQVRKLHKQLLEDGFKPWLDDEDLLPGQDWEKEIPKAVRNSHIVIVCLSHDSINRTGFIQKEIKFALDVAEEQPEGNIFIIPLRLEECEVPERLRPLHWVNLYKSDGYQKLKRSLIQKLEMFLNEILEPALPYLLGPDLPNVFNPLALVMKGGGVKGLAYVGAIKELEKFYKFDWFIGTSAGAIAAILLGAGYTTDELKTLLANKNFYDFLDSKWYKLPSNLLFKKGLYPANKFTSWIDQLLAKKLDSPVRVTLADLPNRVSIYASRREKSALVFDSCDPKTKDIPAAFAVRCSMSIPFIFTPQMEAGMRVLDGGMQNNYPINVLLQDNPKTDFIGLYLGSEHFEGEEKEPSLIQDLFSIWTEANDVESLKIHLKQTVIIDPRPISTIDFKLTDEAKSFLLKTGRSAAFKYLLKQNEVKDEEKSVIKKESVQVKNEVEQEREILIDARRKKKSRIKLIGLLGLLFLLSAFMVWGWRSMNFSVVGEPKTENTNVDTQSPNSSETPKLTNQTIITANSNQENASVSENSKSSNSSINTKPSKTPFTTPNKTPMPTQTPKPFPTLRECTSKEIVEFIETGNKNFNCRPSK